jgi:DcuC family C4-dicarboxylate transporter
VSGLAVLAVALVGLVRGIDVRLVLFAAALALGTIAGDPAAIVQTFLTTLAGEQFVVPICTAMGFAYVLRRSECDQHLVRLLIRPVRGLRPLMIPGAVLAGFVVNIAIISQTSTAIAVGTVLVPLLGSAGYRPAVIGASLLLGASVGGELLNPGAPELLSVAKHLTAVYGAPVDPQLIRPQLGPLLAVQLTVATAVFWLTSGREPRDASIAATVGDDRPVNVIKAVIPLVPLAFLLVAGPPFNLVHVPEEWLVDPKSAGAYGTRLIGATMLAGTALAAVATPSAAKDAARAFFEGVGYSATHVISLIVTANCFGTGVKLVNLGKWVGVWTQHWPAAVWPLSATGAMGFAVLCGSGMASTESLYRFFAQPGWSLDENLAVGANVAIASAAGRTSSPAAAVVLFCATLLGVGPWELLRRVGPPLIAATAVTATVAWFRT